MPSETERQSKLQKSILIRARAASVRCRVWAIPPPPPGKDNAPGSGRASRSRAAAPGTAGARSVDGQELSPAPCGGLRHSSALSGNENIPNRIRAALGKGATREHPRPTEGTDDGFGGGHNTGNDPQLQPLTVGVEPLTN